MRRPLWRRSIILICLKVLVIVFEPFIFVAIVVIVPALSLD